MLNLDLLKESASAITDACIGETECHINGVRLVLRVLTPKQETEVQRYAIEVYQALDDDDEEDSADTLEYFDRFRIALLSHAIVQIGDQDLRDLEYIPTGKKLQSGAEVKIPKEQALREIVRGWTRVVHINLIEYYHQLSGLVESRSLDAIEFQHSDLDTEIQRLTERIQKLEEQRTHKALQKESIFKTIYDRVYESGKDDTKPAEEPEEGQIPVESEIEEVEEAPVERQPAYPTSAPPPPAQVEYEQEIEDPDESPQRSFNQIQDSFNSDVDAEAARIQALRNKGRIGNPQAPMVYMTPDGEIVRQNPQPPIQRQPPHVAAFETQQAMSEASFFSGQETSFGNPNQPRPQRPQIAANPKPPRLQKGSTPRGSRNPRFIGRKK